MQRNSPDDFETLQPERGRRGPGILLALMLAAGLVVAAGAGYGVGRGSWTIPASVTAFVPAPLAQWLPLTAKSSGSAGEPEELNDYAFELVEEEMKQGAAVVDVRLIDRRSGKPVTDAVVFARRIDMAPEGMPTMTSSLEPQPSPRPGVYRFKADLTMEGGWQLSLAAKVQGETGTVSSKLLLKAAP